MNTTNKSVLYDSTAEAQIDAIKKAATGGLMRKVFTHQTDEKGGIVKTAYQLAREAFAKGEAEAAGAIPCLAHDEADWHEKVFDDAGNVVGSGDLLEGMNACVAVVGTRERDAKGKMQSGIKALVMFPMPTYEAFIDNAPDWTRKVIEKETAHVAFRGLRNAETDSEFALAFEKMPKEVEGFVAQHTSGEGLDTEAFDALWNPFRKDLKDSMPAIVDLLPPKGEVLKCIRSKSYAESNPETAKLEEAGVFAFILQSLIAGGKDWTDKDGNPTPIDVSTIEEWAANRHELHLAQRQPKEKDFSALANFGAMLGNLGESEDEGDEA